MQWMERLLQGFLYDDVDSYLCDKTYRELLIADLKSDGLIEKKKVVMTKSAAVEKMLTNSLGKCNSIRDIVFHEYEASGQDLRLLVLTDYIRKEYEKQLEIQNMMLTHLECFRFLRCSVVTMKRKTNKSVLGCFVERL